MGPRSAKFISLVRRLRPEIGHKMRYDARSTQRTGREELMLFMVTFPLTHREYDARIKRFLETGAPPPDGVAVLGRWFTASHSKGFMLIESNDPKAMFRYVSEWSSLIDFTIEPVVTDEEAGAVLKDMA